MQCCVAIVSVISIVQGIFNFDIWNYTFLSTVQITPHKIVQHFQNLYRFTCRRYSQLYYYICSLTSFSFSCSIVQSQKFAPFPIAFYFSSVTLFSRCAYLPILRLLCRTFTVMGRRTAGTGATSPMTAPPKSAPILTYPVIMGASVFPACGFATEGRNARINRMKPTAVSVGFVIFLPFF